MHLEIEASELQYVISIIKTLKVKCKTKDIVVYLLFKSEGTYFVYSSEGLSFRYKCNYISNYNGEFSLSLEFLRNTFNLFNGGTISIDFRDNVVVAQQNNSFYKGVTCGRVAYNAFKIDVNEAEEIPLQLQLSNRLLNLDLEEMGFENKDPYIHLYNISGKHLIKMSSFCALLQTLNKEALCNAVLTQDILSICATTKGEVKYYKYRNGFYIIGDNIELRMPLSNKAFPNLNIIMNNIKNNSENLLLKTDGLLDICEKACILNLDKRLDIEFRDGFMFYNHHNTLTGCIESGLSINWKMSFNPFLMKGILKYINEECIVICKNQGNNILISNYDKSIQFMLALCNRKEKK